MRALAAIALLLLSPLPAAAADPPPLLIRGAMLVTMDEAGTLPDRDLLVRERRIARIAPAGTIEPPPGTVVVDGRGRWLVPGLTEGHAHVPGPQPEGWAEEVLLLYVAHGVTTARSMLGHPSHLDLRQRISDGELLGPRLYLSGPSLNGNSAPDAATATQMVREQHAAGYDFLKLHPGLKREVFDAIVASAREAGIPFSGHVSDDVGITRALQARQSAIDHLDGYLQALADERCLGGSVAPGFFGIGLTDCARESRIPAVVAATRDAGTWMAPTQILIEQWAEPPAAAELRARPAVRYLPEAVVGQWIAARERFLGLPGSMELPRRFVALRRELLRQMHAAGVPILLASDAPQVFNVPGDSALAELELYGEIGLSPADALATGTVNAARFFGAGQLFGRIREGLEADLLLLSADPLADLSALRRLEGVALRGRWLPAADLQRRLDDLAARHHRGE